ncbi:hypothetical protein ACE6H2_001082 [Prunus campanulata]
MDDGEAFGAETGSRSSVLSLLLVLLIIVAPPILAVCFEISLLKAAMSLLLILASLILCLNLWFLRLLWLLIRLRLKHDSSRSFLEKWHTWLDEFVAELNKGNDKNLGPENRGYSFFKSKRL